MAAGNGAVLSHETAAELWGFATPSARIHLSIPGSRTIAAPEGCVVHRSARLPGAAHPSVVPPRTTVDETVVDLVGTSVDEARALDWITMTCQRGATTPQRLLRTADQRGRLRFRDILRQVCAEVDDGATTPLEIRWVRSVERAHGLPKAARQVARMLDGKRIYHDLDYLGGRVVVELDGRRGHELAVDLFRDMHRDNASLLAGRITLRYGWSAVVGEPCAVAAQVADVLITNGWTGRPRRCRRGCNVLI